MAGRYKLYIDDGTNLAERGFVSAEQAVSAGRAYFGETHPWVWVIDVDLDTGTRPSVLVELRSLLEACGCDERLEVRSGGSGRVHVYVYEPEGAVRRREIAGRWAGPAIDFRIRETAGCAIRPPGAPHRNGQSWAEPVDDWDDVEATLGDWAERHRVLVAARIEDLSARDQALLRGDWAEADRLGPKVPRKPDGQVDRSGVDVALARAFRYAGLTVDDFVQARMSTTFRSEKAAEQRNPQKYLRRQWADSGHGGRSIRAGLSQLGDLRQRFVIENEMRLPQVGRVLYDALLSRAEQLQRMIFDWSHRDMALAADMGTGSVSTALDALDRSGLVERCRLDRERRGPETRGGGDRWWKADSYVIVAQPPISEHIRASFSPGYVQDLGVQPSHSAFSSSGLTRLGWAVLSCFSSTEPRRQAEAMATGNGPSSEETFRKYRLQLVEIAALVATDESSRPKYLIASDFDWDSYARSKNLDRRAAEHRLKRSDQHVRDRKDHLSNLRRAGLVSAGIHVDRVAAAEVARSEIEAELLELPFISDPVTDDGRAIDPCTGEIADPVADVRSLARSCRACGRSTRHVHATLDVPLHDRCLFPAWIAKIERAHGVPIPDELVKPAPPPDWGEFADVTELGISPDSRQLVAA